MEHIQAIKQLEEFWYNRRHARRLRKINRALQRYEAR